MTMKKGEGRKGRDRWSEVSGEVEMLLGSPLDVATFSALQ